MQNTGGSVDKMLFENQIGDFQQLIDLIAGRPCEITIKPLDGDKLRTAQQNKALHKDFANTAKALRNANISAKDMFSCTREAVGINEVMVKEFWHSVMIAMGLEPKTSKLTTTQVTKVRQLIERAFAMRLGVDIGEFPNRHFNDY